MWEFVAMSIIGAVMGLAYLFMPRKREQEEEDRELAWQEREAELIRNVQSAHSDLDRLKAQMEETQKRLFQENEGHESSKIKARVREKYIDRMKTAHEEEKRQLLEQLQEVKTELHLLKYGGDEAQAILRAQEEQDILQLKDEVTKLNDVIAKGAEHEAALLQQIDVLKGEIETKNRYYRDLVSSGYGVMPNLEQYMSMQAGSLRRYPR